MSTAWLIIGFLGQGLFGVRVIFQWILSEKMKKSVVPPFFWYISIPAGFALLAYAIWKRDSIFIFNESAAMLIFIRNIMLLRREKKAIA